jgi:hypothetical protein
MGLFSPIIPSSTLKSNDLLWFDNPDSGCSSKCAESQTMVSARLDNSPAVIPATGEGLV